VSLSQDDRAHIDVYIHLPENNQLTGSSSNSRKMEGDRRSSLVLFLLLCVVISTQAMSRQKPMTSRLVEKELELDFSDHTDSFDKPLRLSGYFKVPLFLSTVSKHQTIIYRASAQ
jgi:hypothetical protein